MATAKKSSAKPRTKMVALRYVGGADLRTITSQEFSRQFQESDTVEWGVDNDFTVKVSEKVAEWLLEKHPTEFQKA